MDRRSSSSLGWEASFALIRFLMVGFKLLTIDLPLSWMFERASKAVTYQEAFSPEELDRKLFLRLGQNYDEPKAFDFNPWLLGLDRISLESLTWPWSQIWNSEDAWKWKSTWDDIVSRKLEEESNSSRYSSSSSEHLEIEPPIPRVSKHISFIEDTNVQVEPITDVPEANKEKETIEEKMKPLRHENISQMFKEMEQRAASRQQTRPLFEPTQRDVPVRVKPSLELSPTPKPKLESNEEFKPKTKPSVVPTLQPEEKPLVELKPPPVELKPEYKLNPRSKRIVSPSRAKSPKVAELCSKFESPNANGFEKKVIKVKELPEEPIAVKAEVVSKGPLEKTFEDQDDDEVVGMAPNNTISTIPKIVIRSYEERCATMPPPSKLVTMKTDPKSKPTPTEATVERSKPRSMEVVPRRPNPRPRMEFHYQPPIAVTKDSKTHLHHSSTPILTSIQSLEDQAEGPHWNSSSTWELGSPSTMKEANPQSCCQIPEERAIPVHPVGHDPPRNSSFTSEIIKFRREDLATPKRHEWRANGNGSTEHNLKPSQFKTGAFNGLRASNGSQLSVPSFKGPTGVRQQKKKMDPPFDPLNVDTDHLPMIKARAFFEDKSKVEGANRKNKEILQIPERYVVEKEEIEDVEQSGKDHDSFCKKEQNDVMSTNQDDAHKDPSTKKEGELDKMEQDLQGEVEEQVDQNTSEPIALVPEIQEDYGIQESLKTDHLETDHDLKMVQKKDQEDLPTLSSKTTKGAEMDPNGSPSNESGTKDSNPIVIIKSKNEGFNLDYDPNNDNINNFDFMKLRFKTEINLELKCGRFENKMILKEDRKENKAIDGTTFECVTSGKPGQPEASTEMIENHEKLNITNDNRIHIKTELNEEDEGKEIKNILEETNLFSDKMGGRTCPLIPNEEIDGEVQISKEPSKPSTEVENKKINNDNGIPIKTELSSENEEDEIKRSNKNILEETTRLSDKMDQPSPLIPHEEIDGEPQIYNETSKPSTEEEDEENDSKESLQAQETVTEKRNEDNQPHQLPQAMMEQPFSDPAKLAESSNVTSVLLSKSFSNPSIQDKNATLNELDPSPVNTQPNFNSLEIVPCDNNGTKLTEETFVPSGDPELCGLSEASPDFALQNPLQINLEQTEIPLDSKDIKDIGAKVDPTIIKIEPKIETNEEGQCDVDHQSKNEDKEHGSTLTKNITCSEQNGEKEVSKPFQVEDLKLDVTKKQEQEANVPYDNICIEKELQVDVGSTKEVNGNLSPNSVQVDAKIANQDQSEPEHPAESNANLSKDVEQSDSKVVPQENSEDILTTNAENPVTDLEIDPLSSVNEIHRVEQTEENPIKDKKFGTTEPLIEGEENLEEESIPKKNEQAFLGNQSNENFTSSTKEDLEQLSSVIIVEEKEVPSCIEEPEDEEQVDLVLNEKVPNEPEIVHREPEDRPLEFEDLGALIPNQEDPIPFEDLNVEQATKEPVNHEEKVTLEKEITELENSIQSEQKNKEDLIDVETRNSLSHGDTASEDENQANVDDCPLESSNNIEEKAPHVEQSVVPKFEEQQKEQHFQNRTELLQPTTNLESVEYVDSNNEQENMIAETSEKNSESTQDIMISPNDHESMKIEMPKSNSEFTEENQSPQIDQDETQTSILVTELDENQTSKGVDTFPEEIETEEAESKEPNQIEPLVENFNYAETVDSVDDNIEVASITDPSSEYHKEDDVQNGVRHISQSPLPIQDQDEPKTIKSGTPSSLWSKLREFLLNTEGPISFQDRLQDLNSPSRSQDEELLMLDSQKIVIIHQRTMVNKVSQRDAANQYLDPQELLHLRQQQFWRAWLRVTAVFAILGVVVAALKAGMDRWDDQD